MINDRHLRLAGKLLGLDLLPRLPRQPDWLGADGGGAGGESAKDGKEFSSKTILGLFLIHPKDNDVFNSFYNFYHFWPKKTTCGPPGP